jgi:hypothetical protein
MSIRRTSRGTDDIVMARTLPLDSPTATTIAKTTAVWRNRRRLLDSNCPARGQRARNLMKQDHTQNIVTSSRHDYLAVIARAIFAECKP